jgi:hypothetical protein
MLRRQSVRLKPIWMPTVVIGQLAEGGVPLV